jgi:stalled ribosome alternative rescue factor ArfA
MAPTDPPEPDGIRREKKVSSATPRASPSPPPSLLDAAPLGRSASRVSPMASAAPLAHSSPTAVGSELAPATATPAVSSREEPPPAPVARGDVAKTAATVLAGRGSSEDGVRAALEESAQLARASASARARVAGLRARGASLPELDGRLSAADLLAKRGEPEAALKVLEEVLVLSNALVQAYGPEGPIDIPDPMEVRIDARLAKVFERASEAARARTDELLSSARLAEKVEEIARARLEELLVSKRLAARIEEVASKHAIEVANNAVEALLSSDAFKQAVDQRARARAEEAVMAVKSGSSPEALEAAVEKVVARRENAPSGATGRFAAFDPSLIEGQLGSLVTSLVKQTLSSDAAVTNKMSSIIAEEASRAAAERAVDESQLRLLVAAEVSQQMQANVLDPAERAQVVIRSDAMKSLLEEQFQLFRATVKQEVLEDLTRRANEYRAKTQGE